MDVRVGELRLRAPDEFRRATSNYPRASCVVGHRPSSD